MKTVKYHAPEAAQAAAGAEPVNENKTVNSKTNIPKKDHDFGNVCTRVSANWAANPAITLVFITQPVFDTMVKQYNSTLMSRKKEGDGRSPLTKKLLLADNKMEKGIQNVKTYLKEKYESEAMAYYPIFGIEKHGSNWRLPTDRNKRKDCFEQIKKSIEAEGFGDKKYGTTFWTQLAADYENLMTMADSSDELVSNQVSDKNQLKQELRVILNSLIFVLRGNYPETYHGVLRSWGFQKDKY